MAGYKVLQDIEAEDKLVGPLTLRQFIYAGITAICGYVCFILLTKKVYLGLPFFLLPGMMTGFFAFPWGRDQPTEIWALAKIRFFLKPRQRIWNQSGVKELVTITAPKRVEVNYTNGLSPGEVKSRLHALADTIDTRGWAVKNATAGLYAPSAIAGQDPDRLIDAGVPQAVPTIETTDMLDAQTNPVAINFDRMMQRSDQAHRQQIVQSMARPQPAAQDTVAPQLPRPQLPQPSLAGDQWFMNAPVAPTQTIAPGISPLQQPAAQAPSIEESELAERLRNNAHDSSFAHLHTILPLSEQKTLAQKAAQTAAATKAAQAPVTHKPDPAIMALARNNDLNVATIARQAKRDNPPDEVVISLH